MARKLRVRQADRAALDLRRFWIERLEYEEDEEIPDELPAPAVSVSRPEVLEADEGEYFVTLRLRMSQGEARSIDLTIVGEFRLQSEDEELDRSLRMLAYNGSAILFGAARGVIESVTGVSGFGRMHVPSVNIAELLDR